MVLVFKIIFQQAYWCHAPLRIKIQSDFYPEFGGDLSALSFQLTLIILEQILKQYHAYLACRGLS